MFRNLVLLFFFVMLAAASWNYDGYWTITEDGTNFIIEAETGSTLKANDVDCTTCVDVGDETNLTAGRSLTLTGDTVAADSELYTTQQCVYIEDPTTESLNDIFWAMEDYTITYVWCMTDVGTVTLNIEDGSNNNILSAELVCDTGGQTSCVSGCDVNTINTSYDNISGKTENVDIDISATATTPGKVSLCIGYTIDD